MEKQEELKQERLENAAQFDRVLRWRAENHQADKVYWKYTLFNFGLLVTAVILSRR